MGPALYSERSTVRRVLPDEEFFVFVFFLPIIHSQIQAGLPLSIYFRKFTIYFNTISCIFKTSFNRALKKAVLIRDLKKTVWLTVAIFF